LLVAGKHWWCHHHSLWQLDKLGLAGVLELADGSHRLVHGAPGAVTRLETTLLLLLLLLLAK
jgi:hypothetical protein